MSQPGRIWADPARERLNTPATVITVVRTVASVALSAVAASHQHLTLLVVALVVHWVGDSLDGWVARVRDCETRTGAVLDISAHGAFFCPEGEVTEEGASGPVAVGQVVAIAFDSEPNLMGLDLPCRVRWVGFSDTHGRHGFGLEFTGGLIAA